jgi:hypothetical protein
VTSGSFSNIFSIILMTSNFDILVYIFCISNEHILTSSIIFMDCNSVVRCIAFWMLYALGNVLVRHFSSSYACAFLQLIIGLIGVYCLCSFIVAWR